MTLKERFQHLFNASGSKAAARDRLLSVLVDDRLGLTAEKKAVLKKDILAVIRKHVDIDPDGFTLEFIPASPQSEIQVSAPVRLNGRATAGAAK